jgi:DNA repair and recombination protein RAD52
MDKDLIIRELQKPLDSSVIKQRDQAGRSLSYIESWHAIAEANRIFGHLSWDRQTYNMNMVQCEQKGDKGLWYVSYTARSVITFDGVTREGTGFGQGIDKDLGKAHESAIKEAESDAMKRALMTFGNPFGLALYDKEQRGVAKEMSMEDARNLMKKQVATTWKNMGGTATQFKELDSILDAVLIDPYEFVHSSILDQGLETVEAIQEFANEVATKGKTR